MVKAFRCSMPAAVIGFVMGKLVLPLFLVLNYRLGYLIIGHPALSGFSAPYQAWQEWLIWIEEKGLAYFTGSAIMGVASYLLVMIALQLYRKKSSSKPVRG
nr:DUF2062 domain-containing protein [Brevibacillus invocatus]